MARPKAVGIETGYLDSGVSRGWKVSTGSRKLPLKRSLYHRLRGNLQKAR